MEPHKRLGTVAMALSVVLLLACIVISESACSLDSPYEQSLVKWLLICLRVVVYEDIPGNEYSNHLYIPTKYLLLTFVATFAIGALWYRGVLAVPAKLTTLFSPRGENGVQERPHP